MEYIQEMFKQRREVVARLERADEFRLKKAGNSIFCLIKRDKKFCVYKNKEDTGYYISRISPGCDLVFLNANHVDAFGEAIEDVCIWLSDIKFVAQ